MNTFSRFESFRSTFSNSTGKFDYEDFFETFLSIIAKWEINVLIDFSIEADDHWLIANICIQHQDRFLVLVTFVNAINLISLHWFSTKRHQRQANWRPRMKYWKPNWGNFWRILGRLCRNFQCKQQILPHNQHHSHFSHWILSIFESGSQPQPNQTILRWNILATCRLWKISEISGYFSPNMWDILMMKDLTKILVWVHFAKFALFYMHFRENDSVMV